MLTGKPEVPLDLFTSIASAVEPSCTKMSFQTLPGSVLPDTRMFDVKQTPRSPRCTAKDGENEYEGTPSIGRGGSASPMPKCTSVASPYSTRSPISDKMRPPLTASSNGGDLTPTRSPSVPTDAPTSSIKPPTAPGVSRFGFKPPIVTSLSPRRPYTAAERANVNSQSDMNCTINRVLSSVLSPARSTGSGGVGIGERSVVTRSTNRVRTAASQTALSRVAAARSGTASMRDTRGTTAVTSTTTGYSASRTRRPGTGLGALGRTNTRSQARGGTGMASGGTSRRGSTVRNSVASSNVWLGCP